jgi:heme/copper-type cytochrome/quinol oxidase subunit 2
MRIRHSATLLLALPFVVAMVPAFASPGRAIAVTVSRAVISPAQIVVHVGERVRLNVASTDGAHTCHVKGLRLDALIPAGGGVVTFDLQAPDSGTFEIECLDEGAVGGSVKARFVVKE